MGKSERQCSFVLERKEGPREKRQGTNLSPKVQKRWSSKENHKRKAARRVKWSEWGANLSMPSTGNNRKSRGGPLGLEKDSLIAEGKYGRGQKNRTRSKSKLWGRFSVKREGKKWEKGRK